MNIVTLVSLMALFCIIVIVLFNNEGFFFLFQAHLPFLLENDAKILRENFSNAELSFILHVLKHYENSNKDEFKQAPSEAADLFDVINKIKLKNHVSLLPTKLLRNHCVTFFRKDE